ncbi:uncharacterized protein CLUP02_11407 [Colletotrichum lupini]|uniref:Uncharacterized protein n=1 Tax=Colletotrichum lupini TaxID=145971 RepID=A0A9Q8SZ67_9PEZI|nr:uncharacterized protein CLUP02_11407 [Colletotrichum lupini]UQC85908.1 hypothetical protein CLUP02_11407 [Colletotrichum lupini]
MDLQLEVQETTRWDRSSSNKTSDDSQIRSCNGVVPQLGAGQHAMGVMRGVDTGSAAGLLACKIAAITQPVGNVERFCSTIQKGRQSFLPSSRRLGPVRRAICDLCIWIVGNLCTTACLFVWAYMPQTRQATALAAHKGNDQETPPERILMWLTGGSVRCVGRFGRLTHKFLVTIRQASALQITEREDPDDGGHFRRLWRHGLIELAALPEGETPLFATI